MRRRRKKYDLYFVIFLIILTAGYFIYNGISSEFEACTGDVLTDKALMSRLSQGEYAVVLVNIVADVIIQLAPVLPHFLNRESTLICSGILDTRLADVTDALHKAGLTVVQTKSKEDCRCIIAKRNEP